MRTPIPLDQPGGHVRQGDVLVLNTGALPLGATKLKREHGSVVLAHGEVTGHMHQLRGPQVAKFRDDHGHEHLKVDGRPEALVHEEHTPHTIPGGLYELPVQVEYEPQELRAVAD